VEDLKYKLNSYIDKQVSKGKDPDKVRVIITSNPDKRDDFLVAEKGNRGNHKMKLTKEDIDKVRHIEGFPIGEDEDIIALSDPPYYTACPNPFIEDFIKEHGTPYDEETDDYKREPFAADVSEGKNDPIYNAHSYHTKGTS
jgi:hypothetical protein